MSIEYINEILADSIKTKMLTVIENENKILEAVELVKETFKLGHKVFICGNGGSAADSQHFAAEFIGRFQKERKALPAIALTTDTSALTALGNDYSNEAIFSRQLEGLAEPGDLLVALSTSGNSKNVVSAIQKAKELHVGVLTLTGNEGGRMGEMGNVNIVAKSNSTARIQETHIFILHAICDLVEQGY